MLENLYRATVLVGAALVSACSGSSTTVVGGIAPGEVPASELVTLNATGTLPNRNFSTSETGGIVEAAQGFRYQYGSVRGSNRFLGIAGVLPTTNPGAAPTTATATYAGNYELAHVERGTTTTKSGTLSLAADFTNGTLQGNANGLAVNGTIAGQTIGGTATYAGVSADMEGVIGRERAVAAFAGNSADALLVGGFLTEAR